MGYSPARGFRQGGELDGCVAGVTVDIDASGVSDEGNSTQASASIAEVTDQRQDSAPSLADTSVPAEPANNAGAELFSIQEAGAEILGGREIDTAFSSQQSITDAASSEIETPVTPPSAVGEDATVPRLEDPAAKSHDASRGGGGEGVDNEDSSSSTSSVEAQLSASGPTEPPSPSVPGLSDGSTLPSENGEESLEDWLAELRGQRYYSLYFEAEETAGGLYTMEEDTRLLVGPPINRHLRYPTEIAERTEELIS